jgi:N-acetylated-alpha-linked acidic dipeptidase
VAARARAAIQVRAASPGASEEAKTDAADAADPAKDLPIAALGSGSDYSTFLQHLGIATLDIGYGGEGNAGGVYHSRYDTFEHHTRFVDPGLVYGKVLSETAGHLVIQAADAELPLNTPDSFAAAVGQYLKDVKKLADDKRGAAEKQARMLADKAFALAADPTRSHVPPEPLKQVPKFDFGPLDSALNRLNGSASAYDAALSAHGASLTPAKRRQLLTMMQSIGETLLVDQGLPGRDWYKNMITAPGRFTGYGAKTLPGVREAIEEERFDDAVRYIGLIAGALDAYSARLDQATALLNG